MAKSAIPWTQFVWNVITGCSHQSPGCDHCYAERLVRRLKAMGQHSYERGFEVTYHESMLSHPLRWKKSRLIFVNSMGDLFHPEVPLDTIKLVFDMMRQASWHTFQILTKRAERLEELSPDLFWPHNVWMGVSVEAKPYLYRLDHLRQVPAMVRFVSFEPLLEDLGVLDLSNLNWVITGGESGPGSRPMEEGWVRSIRDQCQAAHVPFFFTQWGGASRNLKGCELEGKIWKEMPHRYRKHT